MALWKQKFLQDLSLCEYKLPHCDLASLCLPVRFYISSQKQYSGKCSPCISCMIQNSATTCFEKMENVLSIKAAVCGQFSIHQVKP